MTTFASIDNAAALTPIWQSSAADWLPTSDVVTGDAYYEARPCVVYDGGLVHLWYNSWAINVGDNRSRIVHQTSTDGINFTTADYVTALSFMRHVHCVMWSRKLSKWVMYTCEIQSGSWAYLGTYTSSSVNGPWTWNGWYWTAGNVGGNFDTDGTFGATVIEEDNGDGTYTYRQWVGARNTTTQVTALMYLESADPVTGWASKTSRQPVLYPEVANQVNATNQVWDYNNIGELNSAIRCGSTYLIASEGVDTRPSNDSLYTETWSIGFEKTTDPDSAAAYVRGPHNPLLVSSAPDTFTAADSWGRVHPCWLVDRYQNLVAVDGRVRLYHVAVRSRYTDTTTSTWNDPHGAHRIGFADLPLPILNAVPLNDHIGLSWSDTASGESGWYVERRVAE